MNYLKLFEEHADYENFVSGGTMMKPNVSHCIAENEVHFNPHTFADEYLTFDILSSGTINWKASSTATTVATISYKLNDGEWTSITSSTVGTSFNVSAGDKVMFKGNNSTYCENNKYNCFSGTTASFNVKGNIMSLISGDSFSNANALSETSAFYNLFNNCTGLETAENLILPTTLSNFCFYRMFINCTSLTTPPKLPATTLTNGCYSNMFNGCRSLTVAPELPATTLASQCYQEMFYGCINLTVAPKLPATTIAEWCYRYMFNGCTRLTVAPELPATTLADLCYFSMFQGCTSLTTAPELPATTLAYGCYLSMFSSCTALTTAPELPATTLANECYNFMFGYCTSLTNTAIVPTSIKPISGEYCCGMYSGCNVQQSSDYDAVAYQGECGGD